MNVDNKDTYFKNLIETHSQLILNECKQNQISNKQIYNLILNRLKKKTVKKKKSIRAIRVPLYISDSSE